MLKQKGRFQMKPAFFDFEDVVIDHSTNFTAVPYAMTSAAPCITAAEA